MFNRDAIRESFRATEYWKNLQEDKEFLQKGLPKISDQIGEFIDGCLESRISSYIFSEEMKYLNRQRKILERQRKERDRVREKLGL